MKGILLASLVASCVVLAIAARVPPPPNEGDVVCAGLVDLPIITDQPIIRSAEVGPIVTDHPIITTVEATVRDTKQLASAMIGLEKTLGKDYDAPSRGRINECFPKFLARLSEWTTYIGAHVTPISADALLHPLQRVQNLEKDIANRLYRDTATQILMGQRETEREFTELYEFLSKPRHGGRTVRSISDGDAFCRDLRALPIRWGFTSADDAVQKTERLAQAIARFTDTHGAASSTSMDECFSDFLHRMQRLLSSIDEHDMNGNTYPMMVAAEDLWTAEKNLGHWLYPNSSNLSRIGQANMERRLATLWRSLARSWEGVA